MSRKSSTFVVAYVESHYSFHDRKGNAALTYELIQSVPSKMSRP
jgi:hypothetical protein